MKVTIPLHITVSIGAPVPATPVAREVPRRTAPPARSKREVVEDFLATGDWKPGRVDTTESTAAPLDSAWLADIQKWRREIRAPQNELLGVHVDGTLERFREFFQDPELTAERLDELLGAMQAVVEDPDAFYDAIEAARTGAAEEGTVTSFLKIPWWFPTRAPSAAERASVGELRARYQLDPSIDINPREHHFEYQDPGWWHLLKAKVMEKTMHWPDGLAPFIQHAPERPFVYPATKSGDRVALFADFGVGQYHSHFIAKKLEDRSYPYVFHLGDVYYGGSDLEFAGNYNTMLDRLMDRSTLFSIPENHELYGGGIAWQDFIRTELGRGRIVQEGSYFCVRWPKHQVVAIDVNWNGRQRFANFDGKRPVVDIMRAWLDDQLAYGKAHGLTSILLTGSAPYKYGDEAPTKLYDDLTEYFHRFHAWFWGDHHYCGLFAYDADKAPFVGSCIGHGGFPGLVQEPMQPSFAPAEWVETETRFPRETELRDDLTNNGWVELTMRADGGIELLYVDWLGAKRQHAVYGLVDGPNGKRLKRMNELRDFGRTDLI